MPASNPLTMRARPGLDDRSRVGPLGPGKRTDRAKLTTHRGRRPSRWASGHEPAARQTSIIRPSADALPSTQIRDLQADFLDQRPRKRDARGRGMSQLRTGARLCRRGFPSRQNVHVVPHADRWTKMR